MFKRESGPYVDRLTKDVSFIKMATILRKKSFLWRHTFTLYVIDGLNRRDNKRKQKANRIITESLSSIDGLTSLFGLHMTSPKRPESLWRRNANCLLEPSILLLLIWWHLKSSSFNHLTYMTRQAATFIKMQILKHWKTKDQTKDFNA